MKFDWLIKGSGPPSLRTPWSIATAEEKRAFSLQMSKWQLKTLSVIALKSCYQVATGERGHAIGVGEVIPVAGFIVKPELLKPRDKAFGAKLKLMTVTIKHWEI